MRSDASAGSNGRPRTGSGRSAGIEVRGLGKVYETGDGRERVFEDLRFEIESRRFVTLLGKSGSGKSTLLNILSEILEPTEGAVHIHPEDDDEDYTLGHVFQDTRLLPWETSVGNIRFVHTTNPDYDDDLARRYLDLVGLADHYDKYPGQLSGGQRQRVDIARAFSVDPHVLLMDEPFSSLDEITAERMREELLELWSAFRKTVFFVTHDIDEAILLSDRMLMLGEGRIFADLEVPLDRPRSIDSDAFLKFRQTALDAFHSLEGADRVD